jgi:hypothetical protein
MFEVMGVSYQRVTTDYLGGNIYSFCMRVVEVIFIQKYLNSLRNWNRSVINIYIGWYFEDSVGGSSYKSFFSKSVMIYIPPRI